MLIPASYIGRMLTSWSDASRRNFLVVAERAGEVVGGTLFHYLAAANAGFSSFMATAPEVRGQGVARLLHEERLRVLDDAAGGRVEGVFIDVVAPDRLTEEEREAERRVGSDPLRRRQVFARLGFRRVDVPYEQPTGGPDGGPVTNMDLLFCPREPAETVPLALVLDTMRAYWIGWLGEKRTERALAALADRAGHRAELPLLPADA
ncbi:GNAT family N-acetyltransferase, partial [Deinococcus pimensis]|uniref:GNAT family N-acetyltransferase n=1 Tax=Deinococcus pimensis TaxID=309888 RepID=UPI000488FB76